MNLLLDTHIAIWSATNSPRLPRSARNIIERASALYISAVTIWEMGLKSRSLKIDVKQLVEGFVATGVRALPITWEHALRFDDIATAHPDPFDRLLLAQAICEPMHLLTSDASLARYSDIVIEV